VNGFSKELQKALGAAQSRIGRPLGREEFWFVLNRVLLALHDAHSSMNPLASGEPIDLPFRWLEDGMVVTEDTEHVRRGDRILLMGDQSEEDLVEKLKELIPAENIHWVKQGGEAALQDLAILRALGVAEDAPVTVVVDRGGARKTLSIPAGRKRRQKVMDQSWVRWTIDDECSLGIFTLDQCKNDEHYRQTVRRFFQAAHREEVRRIAIDVRQNGGGNSNVVDEFLRYIDVPDYYSYSGEVRETADSLAQRGGKGPIGYRRYGRSRKVNQKQEGTAPFTGEIYILTCNHTFSSGNWFAVIFQDNGIGKVLGEPTGNAPSSYGDTLRFTLPESGYSFTLSYKKWVRPDPEKDPADTVVPDIHIPLTRKHILNGTDPLLRYLREEKQVDAEDRR
jgi:C-terminal processing protease CtpA/Prc